MIGYILKLLKMVRRICECVGRHQTVYLFIGFKKNRQETPFKDDNVKAIIKMSSYENLVLYFSEKVQKIAALAMLFLVSSDLTIA